MSFGHYPWGPADAWLSPGCLCHPACFPEQRFWAQAWLLFRAVKEGQFLLDVSGTYIDTPMVCWGGESPLPAYPVSQPCSLFPPLQLHPGWQHPHPKQVSCPPPGAGYPQGQAVTQRWMEGAPCWGVKVSGGGTGVVGGCEGELSLRQQGGSFPTLTPGAIQPLLPCVMGSGLVLPPPLPGLVAAPSIFSPLQFPPEAVRPAAEESQCPSSSASSWGSFSACSWPSWLGKC